MKYNKEKGKDKLVPFSIRLSEDIIDRWRKRAKEWNMDISDLVRSALFYAETYGNERGIKLLQFEQKEFDETDKVIFELRKIIDSHYKNSEIRTELFMKDVSEAHNPKIPTQGKIQELMKEYKEIEQKKNS